MIRLETGKVTSAINILTIYYEMSINQRNTLRNIRDNLKCAFSEECSQSRRYTSSFNLSLNNMKSTRESSECTVTALTTIKDAVISADESAYAQLHEFVKVREEVAKLAAVEFLAASTNSEDKTVKMSTSVNTSGVTQRSGTEIPYVPMGEFKAVDVFTEKRLRANEPVEIHGLGYVDGTSEDIQKYLYNLCLEADMDYPLLLAMWYYEATGYTSVSASRLFGNGSAGLFGFTHGGSNPAKYGVSAETVKSNMDKSLEATFGTTDVKGNTYGSIYYDAPYAIEILKSHVDLKGNLDEGLAQYCGSASSKDKRYVLANNIREQLGWETVDYSAV